MIMLYTNTLHIQAQRMLFKVSSQRGATVIKRSSCCCRGAHKSFISRRYCHQSSYHHYHRISLTCPAATVVAATKYGYYSHNLLPSRHLHPISSTRPLSSDATTSSSRAISLSLADLEYRVTELEQRVSQQHYRLTNIDVQQELWPLLANCAQQDTYNRSSSFSTLRMHQDVERADEAISRAKLCHRILDLCLKEVEDRRIFLWDWLQTTTAATTTTMNNDGNDEIVDNQHQHNVNDNFSPTKFWNEAPHPTKQMFNLVLSSWKNVITSSSSSSSSHHQEQTKLELIEQAAQQASTLLHQMEEEYSSDVAFIQHYNDHVDKGRYTTLLVGAARPDVRNYSEVIGCWGSCIDNGGGGKKKKKKKKERHSITNNNNNNKTHRRNRSDNHNVQDGILQQRLRLEACAMKAMMELLESMEEDLYGTFSDSDTSNTSPIQQQQQRKKPPPDRVCYNIILASMARQLNPSLYEMRLVLQRMMERVQFELESDDNDNHDDGDDEDRYAYAMSFFPDIFSYNALMEARANRATMFTSSETTSSTKYPHHQFDATMQRQHHHRPQQSRWRQQLTNNEVSRPMKSRFTSSEEEAILAEQMLEEMNHISTVSIRPNIWSYNGES
jgi:hypothetical protein